MTQPAIENPDFETAGTGPGQAEGWTVSSSASVFEVAGFDSDQKGFEDYESGWPADAVLGFDDSNLEVALFGGAHEVETYDRQWGPFDGTDPDYAQLVDPAANLPDNSGFVFNLSLLAAAQFDASIVGENFEDFEEGWPDNQSFVFDFVGIGTDLEAAVFDSAPEAVEDYEEEWSSNQSFVFDFVGIGTDLEAAVFDAIAAQDVEDYEEVIDANEIFLVDTAAAGPWVIEFIGEPYTYNAGGGDSTIDIRDGLVIAINESTHPVSAVTNGSTSLVIKNLDPSVDRIFAKGTAPAGGVLLQTTEEAAEQFWLQPLLGF